MEFSVYFLHEHIPISDTSDVSAILTENKCLLLPTIYLILLSAGILMDISPGDCVGNMSLRDTASEADSRPVSDSVMDSATNLNDQVKPGSPEGIDGAQTFHPR